MNNLVLIGRLTSDIEVKKTTDGKDYATFTLAVKRDFKDKSGKYESDFVPCSIFGHQATYLHTYAGKGSMIAVRGSLNISNYEAAGGEKRTSARCQVSNVMVVAPKQQVEEESTSATLGDSAYVREVDEDDLPF